MGGANKLLVLKPKALCQITKVATTSGSKGPTTAHEKPASVPRALNHGRTLPAHPSTGNATFEGSSSSVTSRQQVRSIVVPTTSASSKSVALGASYPVTRHQRGAYHQTGQCTMTAVDGSPMERWERESITDQVWNGIAGVFGEYIGGSQITGVADGRSMIVEPSDSDEAELKGLA